MGRAVVQKPEGASSNPARVNLLFVGVAYVLNELIVHLFDMQCYVPMGFLQWISVAVCQIAGMRCD